MSMPPSHTERAGVWQIRAQRLTGVCIQFPVRAPASDAAREVGEERRGGEESESPEATSPAERLWVRLALSVTLRNIMRDQFSLSLGSRGIGSFVRPSWNDLCILFEFLRNYMEEKRLGGRGVDKRLC